ncbi:hypothetical protein [Flavobacterium terrae]|uniref:Uncharacterized protein n=1 Tax=Flavobacterium terrae TaxID=415425 RepID=A0A1M6HH20_9FLAO|nr:hypothetical protein [Flavobacterium terrae]SHJ21526.1 hypothetical protein SAMN05444363_0010 [Flavobacterium terrae]
MKNIFIKNKPQYHFSESEKEKENTILIWKGIVGFFGCLCFFYSIRQSNLFVIIGLDFILKLYTVLGLIFTILLYKIDKVYEKNDYSFIVIYFQKFFTYGSIFLAVFIFTNKHLSTSKEYEITTLILEKKEGNHRSANEITVKIGESKTEINVHKYSFEKIEKSNYAKIKLKKGYWNKLLILDTKLTE